MTRTVYISDILPENTSGSRLSKGLIRHCFYIRGSRLGEVITKQLARLQYSFPVDAENQVASTKRIWKGPDKVHAAETGSNSVSENAKTGSWNGRANAGARASSSAQVTFVV